MPHDPVPLPEGVEIETMLPYEVAKATASRFDNQPVVLVKSDDDGDLTIRVPAGVSCHAKRDGLGKGNCLVLGDGNGTAVRSGGDGNAVRDGKGDGNAWRSAQPNMPAIGNAVRRGSGNGGARRTGPGEGHSVRSGGLRGLAFHDGRSIGDAMHTQLAGDAERVGTDGGQVRLGSKGQSDGIEVETAGRYRLRFYRSPRGDEQHFVVNLMEEFHGNRAVDLTVTVPDGKEVNVDHSGSASGSVHVRGPGKGNATRRGSGSGDATRSGDGPGDACRYGSGAGNALRKGSGAGDAVRSPRGEGEALHEGSGEGEARILAPYGASQQAATGPGF